MLAREIMIPEPFVAAAGATSAEVALLMRAKDISVVPVVDNPKDRRYLGTISDRDIVTGCVAAGHDPMTCKVQTHARQDTEVVTLDTELEGYKIERLDDKDTHIRSTIVTGGIQDRAAGRQRHAYPVDDCGSGREQESGGIHSTSGVHPRDNHCQGIGSTSPSPKPTVRSLSSSVSSPTCSPSIPSGPIWCSSTSSWPLRRALR